MSPWDREPRTGGVHQPCTVEHLLVTFHLPSCRMKKPPGVVSVDNLARVLGAEVGSYWLKSQ
jgi:hypothetical protein